MQSNPDRSHFTVVLDPMTGVTPSLGAAWNTLTGSQFTGTSALEPLQVETTGIDGQQFSFYLVENKHELRRAMSLNARSSFQFFGAGLEAKLALVNRSTFNSRRIAVVVTGEWPREREAIATGSASLSRTALDRVIDHGPSDFYTTYGDRYASQITHGATLFGLLYFNISERVNFGDRFGETKLGLPGFDVSGDIRNTFGSIDVSRAIDMDFASVGGGTIPIPRNVPDFIDAVVNFPTTIKGSGPDRTITPIKVALDHYDTVGNRPGGIKFFDSGDAEAALARLGQSVETAERDLNSLAAALRESKYYHPFDRSRVERALALLRSWLREANEIAALVSRVPSGWGAAVSHANNYPPLEFPAPIEFKPETVTIPIDEQGPWERVQGDSDVFTKSDRSTKVTVATEAGPHTYMNKQAGYLKLTYRVQEIESDYTIFEGVTLFEILPTTLRSVERFPNPADVIEKAIQGERHALFPIYSDSPHSHWSNLEVKIDSAGDDDQRGDIQIKGTVKIDFFGLQ